MVQLDNKSFVAPATNRAEEPEHGDAPVACYRVRHITSVQICNFTPSPVRDAVASVLAQSPPRPSGGEAHFADDTDVNRNVKRSRRISASSVSTLRNVALNGIEDQDAAEASSSRPRTLSTASSVGRERPSLVARRGTSVLKGRKSDSLASAHSLGGGTYDEVGPSEAPSLLSISGFGYDYSQKALENVLRSRLVETFMTVHAISADCKAPSGYRYHHSPPDYLSPIHHPSTNPTFQLSSDDLPSWADMGASRLKVTVYGKVQPRRPPSNGKGKEPSPGDSEDGAWSLLQSWTVDLDDLVLLNEEEIRRPSRLAFNSLILTMGPLGERYRLPRRSTRTAAAVANGSSSDTESDPRTAGHADVPTKAKMSAAARSSTRDKVVDKSSGARRRYDNTRTASWQDLIKLGTLQTSIADMERSMEELVATIDEVVLADGVAGLRRQVSEAEYLLQFRRDEVTEVARGSDELRQRLESRREELDRRRTMLAAARAANKADLQSQTDAERCLSDERDELQSLRDQLLIMRRALVTRLSGIYAIEMVSPADLLFNIVSAPLPIPLSTTDPAPPLSLPQHREVTEDSVATALGYAAHVVQLLAGYLGHILVYPITFVGSRSLIRDEISAIVGPRMFPLYSKGVDTYRFEYGVFLLNKNIEMLMAERDLRALDIRHTLPNLKNLLLTLTDAEVLLMPIRQRNDSMSSLLSLSTGSTATVAATSDSSDPDDAASAEDSPSAPSTPKADSSRKSKSYFGLSPLSGFLRGRYPASVSTQPSVKAVAEAGEEDPTTPLAPPSPVENDDQADRITVRGVTPDVAGSRGETESKHSVPGHADGEAVPPAVTKGVKVHKVVITTTPATPASPVVS